MKTNVFVAIAGLIVGGLIVLAYSLLIAPGRPSSPCGGSPHCHDVSVITVNSKPQIVPIADDLVHDQGVIIVWKIASSGYTFPTNPSSPGYPGIVFNKPAAPTPAGEFQCTQQSSKEVRCKDTYHTMGTFGYTVTLDAVPPLDPFIVNG